MSSNIIEAAMNNKEIKITTVVTPAGFIKAGHKLMEQQRIQKEKLSWWKQFLNWIKL